MHLHEPVTACDLTCTITMPPELCAAMACATRRGQTSFHSVEGTQLQPTHFNGIAEANPYVLGQYGECMTADSDPSFSC